MQAKRHSATSGMPSVQGQMRVASQAPLEPAPKPQSYAQAVSHGLGQGQMHMYGSHSNDGAGQGFGDDGTEQQLTTLSQVCEAAAVECRVRGTRGVKKSRRS